MLAAIIHSAQSITELIYGRGNPLFDNIANIANIDQSSMVDSLVSGWIEKYESADRQITWLEVEKEFSIYLDEHTLLVGKIDAIGRTKDGDTFFLEIKSQKAPPPYKKFEWKQTYRMNFQTLTYGVVVDLLYPGTRRFTVRKAFKSSPPAFDHEWFSYSTEEIEWWRSELLNIAEEIREWRKSGLTPWAPNFGHHCFKYGPKYVCPYFESACSKLNWNGIPPSHIPRVSHLKIEQGLIAGNLGTFNQKIDKRLVILGASRVDTYRGCNERFRRDHEGEGALMEPMNENLQIGSDLHKLLEQWYLKLRREQNETSIR
jgi:hypothetical protein